MNLLVVDDEQIILNGILNPKNWENIEIDNVYSATDADEAMNIIKEKSVDIVMTDITMPGKTGLDLCDEISKQYPDIYLIILSGYDYFEYAQKALSIGVKEYLLKPATIEKILDAVKTAIKRRKESKAKSLRINELEDLFSNSINQLRENWIVSLIKREPLSHEELKRDMELYSVKLPYDGISLALIKKEDLTLSSFWRKDDEFLVQFAILNIVTELLQNYEIENLIAYDMFNNLLVIYRIEDLQKAEKCFDELSGIVKDTLDVKLNIGVSQTCSFKTLKNAWQYAQNQVESTHGSCEEPDSSRKIHNTLMHSHEIEEAVIQNVFDGKPEETEKCINSLFDYFGQINDFTYLRSVCIGLTFVFSQRMFSETENILSDTIQKRDFVLKLRDVNSEAQLKEYITDLFVNAAGIIKVQRESESRDVIKSAQKYILANLDKDISLRQVSAFVFMNSNYFSNLFKRKTGTSFTEYVSNAKIDKAKELLCDESNRILDIALKLGFKDQRYFSSFFKNRVGLTPTQYREEMMDKS